MTCMEANSKYFGKLHNQGYLWKNMVFSHPYTTHLNHRPKEMPLNSPINLKWDYFLQHRGYLRKIYGYSLYFQHPFQP